MGARIRSTAVAVVGLLAAVLLVAGCDGSDKPEADPGTTPTAARVPAAPPENACYNLALSAVLEPSNDAAPVSCKERHTTRTIYVGRIDPLVDGHLLAVDSRQVQQQIARACRARAAAHLGGSEETRRLSRLHPAWFSPTLAQSEAGALWFRCDLVLAGPDELRPLPAKTAGILDTRAAGGLATCANTAPANKAFVRMPCASKHTWRARATIDLTGDKYLDPKVTRAADAACKDIDARIARDSLKLKWSFEWPTEEQWRTGQRYGYCWTPDPA